MRISLPAPPLPLQPAVVAPLEAHLALPAHTARHPHSLTHEASGTTTHGTRAHAEHPLDAGRQAQAEAGEEGGQRAAGEERQDDEGEDLDRVALSVVDQVPEQALELLVGAGEEVGPRRAAVGRGRGAVLVCGTRGCVLVGCDNLSPFSFVYANVEQAGGLSWLRTHSKKASCRDIRQPKEGAPVVMSGVAVPVIVAAKEGGGDGAGPRGPGAGPRSRP